MLTEIKSESSTHSPKVHLDSVPLETRKRKYGTVEGDTDFGAADEEDRIHREIDRETGIDMAASSDVSSGSSTRNTQLAWAGIGPHRLQPSSRPFRKFRGWEWVRPEILEEEKKAARAMKR